MRHRAEIAKTTRFLKACDLAAQAYEYEARTLARACAKVGEEAGTDFWLELAEQARQAEGIYRKALCAAKTHAVAQLQQAGLHPFAAALATGDFVKHLSY